MPASPRPPPERRQQAIAAAWQSLTRQVATYLDQLLPAAASIAPLTPDPVALAQ